MLIEFNHLEFVNYVCYNLRPKTNPHWNFFLKNIIEMKYKNDLCIFLPLSEKSKKFKILILYSKNSILFYILQKLVLIFTVSSHGKVL